MNTITESYTTLMGINHRVTVEGMECGRLEISLRTLKHDRDGIYRDRIMQRWVKGGKLAEWLDTTWHVEVCEYAEDGSCRSAYNPTVSKGGCGRIINFAWMLEGTPENADRIVREVIRMAENGIVCY